MQNGLPYYSKMDPFCKYGEIPIPATQPLVNTSGLQGQEYPKNMGTELSPPRRTQDIHLHPARSIHPSTS